MTQSKKLKLLILIAVPIISGLWALFTYAFPPTDKTAMQSNQSQTVQNNEGFVIGNNANINTLNQTIVREDSDSTNEKNGYLSSEGGSALIIDKPNLDVENAKTCSANSGSKATILETLPAKQPLVFIKVKVLTGSCKDVIGWVTNETFHYYT